MDTAPPATARAGASTAGTKGVPREDREGQIVQIATEQFGVHGFKATSIGTIADRAGISKPLIYSYFGSKEGLYAACYDAAATVVGDELARIADGPAVGVERALLSLGGVFRVLGGRLHLWSLLGDPTRPTSSPVRATARRHGERMTALAHDGVGEFLRLSGNTEPLDESAMVAVWMGIIDSLMFWWIEHPDQTADQMTARSLRLGLSLFGGGDRRLDHDTSRDRA